jgi:hypothetical protein
MILRCLSSISGQSRGEGRLPLALARGRDRLS